MVLRWQEKLCGVPPQAWTWYTSAELDKRDTSFKLDSAEALIVALVGLLEDSYREKNNFKMSIDAALHELGVPGPGYPAPVANAVDLLSSALETT